MLPWEIHRCLQLINALPFNLFATGAPPKKKRLFVLLPGRRGWGAGLERLSRRDVQSWASARPAVGPDLIPAFTISLPDASSNPPTCLRTSIKSSIFLILLSARSCSPPLLHPAPHPLLPPSRSGRLSQSLPLPCQVSCASFILTRLI